MSKVPTRTVRMVALGSAAALAITWSVLPANAAVSDTVVVNEVYGGGGNSGATYTTDYIELANLSDSTVSLDGWSVQYHSGSATGGWQVTPLTGSVEPGALYLIAEADGAGGTQPLPDPQVTGTIPMSGTSGTVALVDSTDALTCTADDCAGTDTIVDLVGFGTAAIAEGAPIAGVSNTLSAQRGAADTDDNAADFAVAAPTPAAENSAGEPAPECPAEPGDTRIHDIQGDGWISPLDGQQVTDVPGVVTGARQDGFWFQDPEADDNPATSEGVFVYTGSAPAVSAGDAVMVTAEVSDYYPLSSGETFPDTANLSITELTDATVAVCSTGNALPDVEQVTGDTIPDRYAPESATGNVEDVDLDPANSTMEFWEAHEGMLVSVQDTRVIGPGNQYGEIYVTVKPDEYASQRGGAVNTGYDNTPTGRIALNPVSGSVPQANVGDVLSGATTGPVDYILYGGYSIAATQVGDRIDNGLTRQTAQSNAPEQLSVGSYNVENLSPEDSASKFAELAGGIVTNLSSPDIVALEEIQDNTGPTDDGVTAADQTLDMLVDAIVEAGGPAYQWRQIDPEDKVDGGQPGGNIRVAFLYNPQRVEFVDRAGGDATTPVDVTDEDGRAGLSVSPGRIAPTDSAWEESRKPLAGLFTFNGENVIVVANHFNSKGGDQNADGRYQPPTRSSEEQRTAQAAIVNDFVDQILAVDPDANVVVAGDINDYQFSPALDILTGGTEDPALIDLITTLPETEQYSYVFNGVSQVLDHILVSPALAADVEYEVIHLNAEFADQMSDHDPEVARLTVGDAPSCDATVSGNLFGSIPVSEGVVCVEGATVTGSVTVADGASLIITDSTVTGVVRADGAASVALCGSTVVGPITVSGSDSVTIGGDCQGNRITGPIVLTGNTGGVTVGGNSLIGVLSCKDNAPAPGNAGTANHVLGITTGQCRGL